jgi:selenocysteine lyase/cysteine desulfurase
MFGRGEHAASIWPNTFGYNGSMGLDLERPDARRFESLGQRDDGAIAGLGLAARIHHTLGRSAVHARVAELATRLKTGLTERGIELVTPMSSDYSHGVVIVDVPRDQSRPAFQALYTRFGIAAAPTGGLRLCPHIYNTEAQIDYAVGAVASVLGA